MKKFIIALLASTALVLTGCTSSSEPADLTGDWAYSSDTFDFTATVADEEIQINLVLADNGEGLFWLGTVPATVENGASFTSQGDTDALDASLFGSSEKVKPFQYKDGKILYEFTILGASYDIALERV